jgi:acyl-CoA dehydrogenase
MFVEAIEKILQSHCTTTLVRQMEVDRRSGALWSAIEEGGFLELVAAEADGGAELTLPDLFPVFQTFGRYAVPLPIGQTIVARTLLRADQIKPSGMITLATSCQIEANGGIRCPFVPHGAHADIVIAPRGNELMLLPTASAQRDPTGVPRSSTATLTWKDARGAVHLSEPRTKLLSLAAALHAALLSGAMTTTFELTLQFCNDRIQFGRPLGKFQAVQHQLSVMAEHIAAASVAAEAAFSTRQTTPSIMSAAIAKSRASEAAVVTASTAHALHGAIGVTEEYDLQLFTRRLHEWRMAHGSENHWNKILGEHFMATNASIASFAQTNGEIALGFPSSDRC